ncbi:MAG: B-box zinc finger protein [Chloroflexi bacterium]|nr:B-box zinc finger protein [Chloroflexota bacterium]MBU1746726.1 B-box zinc finger protein [Chloroflexota bacterium]MBU1879615.1 B-box zinc finger protein [Chloroflexota bacterium]
MPETLYCANHPDTETVLRCSKCAKPICTRCIVQTPVGARCHECANLKRLPIYQVGAGSLLKALLVGTAVAFVVGGLILNVGGWFLLFLAAIPGLAVAQAINWATNYKRGRPVQIVAGISLAVGTILGGVTLGSLGMLLQMAPGESVAALYMTFLIGQALNPWAWLFIALAIASAVARLH